MTHRRLPRYEPKASSRMPSATYKELREAFSWRVPECFNFGVDVVDRKAREADSPALIWENEVGDSETYRFSDIALLTNKLANALRTRGIRKGDRLIVMLPRIPAWLISMVAALKIGAVPIPCIEMLTAGDLGFRIEHSAARGVICCSSQVPKFEGLTHGLSATLAIGGAPGWDDFDAAIETAADRLQPA